LLNSSSHQPPAWTGKEKCYDAGHQCRPVANPAVLTALAVVLLLTECGRDSPRPLAARTARLCAAQPTPAGCRSTGDGYQFLRARARRLVA
jgi:hypothetical protein